MTVSELIEELRKYDGDMQVDVYDHRYFDLGELIRIEVVPEGIYPLQLGLYPAYEDGED